jgi:hypothetical protein
MLLSVRGTAADGSSEALASPLLQTTAMFIAMLLALPLHFFVEWRERAATAKGGYQAIVGVPAPPTPAWVYFAMVAPSIFDMLATGLCMFGLVAVNVSVYQMLRGGSSIAFTSLLKHFCLPGEGLAVHNWAGVALCLVSIVLCGVSVALDPGSSGSSDDAAAEQLAAANLGVTPSLGVGLILGGGLVQALQYVFEERVMGADVGLAPLLVVGLEGLWGTVLCAGLVLPLVAVLPGADHGHLEDPLNSLSLMAASPGVQLCFGAYLAFIFAYNALSVMVTKELNAVWHSILDLWRPLTVWGLNLAAFYGAGPASVPAGLGEAWRVPSSWLQLLAMGVLLFGTAVYNGSVALPQALYRRVGLDRPTPRMLKSPALTRSPLLVRSIEAREAIGTPGSSGGGSVAQAMSAKERLAVVLPLHQGLGARRNTDQR